MTLIKTLKQWQESENNVTPERIYLNRRKFMTKSGVFAASAVGGMLAANKLLLAADGTPLKKLPHQKTRYNPGEELTTEQAITSYNNFYEFGTNKTDPAKNAHRLTIEPWKVKVMGLTEAPGVYDIDDLIDYNNLEERIYRLRCVEAWSMVIPWVGVSLASVLEKLKPLSTAKYVRFQTKLDTEEMPWTLTQGLDFPYVEGLRMDEALNPLSFMAVGLYGKELPKQNGAPMRLVVPWKYGFKSIKSIVSIEFTDQKPLTTWEKSAPHEYGFYANVNPNVDHPRWRQGKERRIGEFRRRETLMFNGYEEEVAHMYKDMDLTKFY